MGFCPRPKWALAPFDPPECLDGPFGPMLGGHLPCPLSRIPIRDERAHALQAVSQSPAAMLRKACASKVHDGIWNRSQRVVVLPSTVPPESVELIYPKHDADNVNSLLGAKIPVCET